MANIYFTPGPTHIHPVARKAFNEAFANEIASISHRSREFEKIYAFTTEQLRRLFSLPDNYQIFFLTSGTESWERIIQGGTDSKSQHYINGAFSKKFAETSAELGREVISIEKEPGEGFFLKDIADPKNAELIALTLNETSTGTSLENGFIENLNGKFPDRLIAVDAVSAAPIPEVDLSRLDYYFFSVQKFFSMPAGLGVLFVSERALGKARKLAEHNKASGCHHNLINLLNFAVKNQTPATPNVISIYVLGKMTEHFNKIGIDTLRQQTTDRADMFYSFLDSSKRIKAFIKDGKVRSQTVFTVEAGNKAKEIMKSLAEAGMIAGEGYGKLKDSQFRIANFAALETADFERLITNLKQFA